VLPTDVPRHHGTTVGRTASSTHHPVVNQGPMTFVIKVPTPLGHAFGKRGLHVKQARSASAGNAASSPPGLLAGVFLLAGAGGAASVVVPTRLRRNRCKLMAAGSRPGDIATGQASGSTAELEAQLQRALEKEDYMQAAQLRDALQDQAIDKEAAVLAANSRFFDAYEARDLELMSQLWQNGLRSCCIHASRTPVYGFDAVMESWEDVFMRPKRRTGEVLEQSVAVCENMGRVVRCERLANGTGVVVTNHFEDAPEGWKLCCHQVSTIAQQKEESKLARLVDNITNWFGRRWRQRAPLKKPAMKEGEWVPQLPQIVKIGEGQ